MSGRRSRVGLWLAAVALLAVGCSDDHGSPDRTTTIARGSTSAPSSAGDATTELSTTSSAPATGDPSTTEVPDTTLPATSVPPAAGVQVPPLLENGDGAHDALSGVGRLAGLGVDCTAFLVDTVVQEAPAYALTAGRCLGLADSRSVLVDRPGRGMVAFNRFVDTDEVAVGVAAVRWATMRGTDLAVLQLDATLGELTDGGVAAYRLQAAPLAGSEIRVVGVPVAGVEPDEYFVRADDCAAGSSTRLLEQQWVWDMVQRNDCDAIVEGNAGSPVFDPSGAVVGMVNTTTLGASPGGECARGHACEVGPAGVQMVADTSYAVPVDGLTACFPAGAFDPVGCGLEPASPPVVLLQLGAVQRSPAAWQLAVDADADAVDVVGKAGPIPEVDCRDPQGYAPIDPVGFDPDPPVGEGFSIACATTLAGGRPDTVAASFVVLQVDDTPPVVDPQLSVVQDDDGYLVEPLTTPPELADHELKVGPVASTDCDDPTGYGRAGRDARRVETAALPASVCVIGYDLAGNATPPSRFELA